MHQKKTHTHKHIASRPNLSR